MIKPYLADTLQSEVNAIGKGEIDRPVIEIPRDASHGDYATNLCFKLAKTWRRAPHQIAEEISTQLNTDSRLATVCSLTALNGFLNLSFKTDWLISKLSDLTQNPIQYPKIPGRFLLEYVSANPTGPLHIGHGRWAIIGDVLARLYREVGVDLTTEFYVNNAGNQIKTFQASVAAARDGKPIPEDGYHGSYIAQLAQQDQDPVATMIESHRQVLTGLGVEFDDWFLETSLHDSTQIDDAFRLLDQKGAIYEKDGAVWFKSSEWGDEKDRVLRKQDGALTYFAVDVAYHLNKLSRGFDQLINIWGADHHGYIPRVRAVLSVLSPDATLSVILGQLVALYRDGQPVRMSKRTGEIITLSEVMEEIGVDATRYFMVQKSPDTHLEFDLSLAVKKSRENPVYYTQYAHARICRILEKLDITQLADRPEASLLDDPKSRQLLVVSAQVADMIYESAYHSAPHKLAQYAYQLARAFHLFYEACPVGTAPPDQQAARVWLIQHVKAVLAKCLGLLGISAPTRM